MKKITLVLALSCIVCGSLNLHAMTNNLDLEKYGRVNYFSFDIERITGIPENQIQEYGCLYKIEKNQFYEILNRSKKNRLEKYDENDVRAKVSIADETFFIDYNGSIKTNSGYFKLDKKKFSDSLVQIGECN